MNFLIQSDAMHYVYILLSQKDARTYVGSSADFERRLAEHNAGKSKATMYRRPLSIFSIEEYPSSKEAKKRELWWKSGAGRRKLKEYFSMTTQ